nr:T9SS type A sorting domain-containing protein [uncultured Mucilaginibacter sp.]
MFNNNSSNPAASRTGIPVAGSASWRFWVAATNATTSTGNGYAIIHNGNQIQVKRYTNGNVGSDMLSYTFPSNTGNYSIRLTRSTTNLWTLYVDAGTAEATTQRGTTNDNTYFNSGSATVYSVLEACDAGTSNRFVWDNIKISQSALTVGYNTNSVITSSTIIYPGAISYPIYSFQLTATEDLYMQYMDIATNVNTTSAFASLKMYRSTDNVYDGGDTDVSSSFTQLTVNSTYLRFYNNSGYLVPDGSNYYYFVVATTQTSYSNVPAATTLSINSSPGSFAPIANTGFLVNAYSHSSPSQLTFGAFKDWVGNNTTDFNDGSNWSPSGMPTSTDIVRVGVLTFYRQPTVTAAYTVGGVILNTSIPLSGAIALTANANLTVSGDFTVTSNLLASSAVSLAGTGTIAVGGAFYLGDATVPGNNKTFSFANSVAQLNITGNLQLTSSNNSGQRDLNAGFISAASKTLSFANLVTNNTGTITSTLSVGDNSTLNLSGAAPFGSLSSTGTNTITLGTGLTIGYTGTTPTNQTVYTNAAIANSNLTTGIAYNNVVFSGSGTKTVLGGAFSAAGTLTTSGTAIVDYTVNNPTIAVTGLVTIGTGSSFKQGSGALTFTGSLNSSGTITGSSSTFSVGNLTALTGGTFTTGSGLVTLSNGLDNTDGVLVVNGNMSIGNAVRQFAGTGVGSMTFGSGTVTIASGVQLFGGTLNAGTGSISFGNGLQIFSGAVFNGGASPGTMSVVSSFTNSGTFSPNTGTITFKGGYTNSNTFTYGGGTIIFDNPNNAAQTLLDNSSGGTAFNNVTFKGINTAAGVINLTTSGSGKYTVASTGVLTLGNATTKLAVAGTITLKSDASGSAAVAAISSGSSITGSVITQRYVTGGTLAYRGYRLFSSPIYEATTGGNNVYGVAYTKTSAYITGTSGTGGFDQTSTTPTIYLYREDKAQSSSPTGGNFRGINKINNTPSYDLNLDNEVGIFNIPVGNGFMFFFRGNRATNSSTTTTVIPDAATFSNTGTLNQGTITVKNWYTPGSTTLGYTPSASTYSRGFNLVGNPYASTIDWGTFSDVTSTAGIYGPNIANATYVYNAALKSYAVWNGASGTNNATRYIPSGQGFYVLATTSSPSLNFKEIAKVPTQQVTGINLFMGTPAAEEVAPQFVRVQLTKDETAKEDIILQFNKSAKETFVLGEDLPYMRGSSAVSLSSFTNDNKETSLAINQVPFPKKSVSIPLNVLTNATGIYQLALTEAKNIPQMFDVWLMDAYKKDSLDIKHNSTYNFNVNSADATTFGADRFKLVVRTNTTYSYKLLDFAAAKQSTAVQLTWKAENEENYTYFTVERSTNGGKTFEVLGSAVGKSQGTYGLEDKMPATGENQYRLKQEDYFGTITYSKIIPVMYTPASDVIADDRIVSVYPNPSSATLNIAVKTTGVNVSTYSITITSTSGRTVKTIKSTQPDWQGNVSDLLPGTYFIQVINNKDNSVVGKSTFIKI